MFYHARDSELAVPIHVLPQIRDGESTASPLFIKHSVGTYRSTGNTVFIILTAYIKHTEHLALEPVISITSDDVCGHTCVNSVNVKPASNVNWQETL